MLKYNTRSEPERLATPAWSSDFNRHFQMVLTKYSPNQEGSIDMAYEEAKSHPSFARFFATAPATPPKAAAGKENSQGLSPTQLSSAAVGSTGLRTVPKAAKATASVTDPAPSDSHAGDNDAAMVHDHAALDRLEDLPQLSQISFTPPPADSTLSANPHMPFNDPRVLHQFATTSASPHNDGHIDAGPSQGYATQGSLRPSFPHEHAQPAFTWTAPQKGSPLPPSSGSSSPDAEAVSLQKLPNRAAMALQLSKHFRYAPSTVFST